MFELCYDDLAVAQYHIYVDYIYKAEEKNQNDTNVSI